jgi:DNA topoisomerase-2
MYEKLNHREHILRRPDSYIGTLNYDPELGMSQGLYKIIDEIVVNAYDEYVRDSKRNEIRMTVSGNRITISNNTCIPVMKYTDGETWLVELIFGHLLTSSNYDDSKDRYTGGRNGYGAKLTNVYSKFFKVTSCDPLHGLEYTQTWRDNMSVCDPGKITKYTKKTGWVHIEFEPDESRLGKFNEGVLKKRMIEIGVWGPKVFFNNENVSCTFKEFAGEGARHVQDGWEIIVKKSEDGFFQVSFVNGVSTRKGGTHIDYIVSSLCKLFKSKIRPHQLKQHIQIFAKVSINKPEFSTQTKDELTSEISDTLEFKPKFIKDILSMDIGHIFDVQKLKKSDGTKKSKITGIPKLDDANWAGTSKSGECTLIITEGDSAKALAVAGISIVGRDRYGVFPLKGKPKNVRDSSVSDLESNKEFSNIKKILGLKQGEVYADTSRLRYNRLMIMTDADLDGSHIKGLVLNMFEFFWPSLLKIGFVVALVTPVVKADREWFFTEEEFKRTQRSFRDVKYYKGLGTSTSAEAKEYFKMIDRLTVSFVRDSLSQEAMSLAFAKGRANDRKTWISDYMKLSTKPYIQYGSVQQLTITDFIHKDQIKFSEEDNIRSIPHLMDGLKPCQRKVLFGCIKRNLMKSMALAQLAGYIGDVSAYHHGETSLHGTIIGMARDYVGSSNNINLLVPSGQFGTRLEGGSDHASARYLWTRLSDCTTKIFDERDSCLLTWLFDDVKKIEPEFYVPVIPMILVNGANGIGTGYSTFIPPYNPKDIIENINRLLKKEKMKPMIPWYKGFKGSVKKKGHYSWIFSGVYENGWVTELPPGVWTQDYKEYLEKNSIPYENHSTESEPRFKVAVENIPTRTIHTSNMYLITQTGLRKFESPEEIIFEYAKIRLAYYKLRKEWLLKKYTETMNDMNIRIRFISLVISGDIQIFMKTRKHIEESLEKLEFSPDYWETLLNIKTYQYTYEEVEKIKKSRDKLMKTIEELKSTPVVNLWKSDLELFQE